MIKVKMMTHLVPIASASANVPIKFHISLFFAAGASNTGNYSRSTVAALGSKVLGKRLVLGCPFCRTKK